MIHKQLPRAVLGLSLALAACSETNLAGGQAKAGKTDKPSDDAQVDQSAGGTLRATQTFTSKNAKSPVDMVWIIDNSGSMGDKIRQVEKNLNRFVDSVGGRTDMKLAVITEFCGGPGSVGGDPFATNLCLTVDDGAVKMKRIDVNVGSYNALGILLSAQAEKGAVGVGNGEGVSFGGQNYKPQPGQFGGYLEGASEILAAGGTLKGFWRDDATRVFVVVSDEEDYSLGADNYLSAVAKVDKKAADAKFFGFVGIVDSMANWGTPSMDPSFRDCMSLKSTAYPSLASTTGGATFDVCDDDWSDKFDQLTEAVVEAAGGDFQLDQADVVKIHSVKVDGKELDKSKYELKGRKLELDDGVIGAKSEVVVEYEYKAAAKG